jgi:hypothetical protein
MEDGYLKGAARQWAGLKLELCSKI